MVGKSTFLIVPSLDGASLPAPMPWMLVFGVEVSLINPSDDFIFLHTDTTSNGTVRLVGGSSDNEGRVEIFYGEWGTVCDDFWGLEDATVVCRQLGYLRAVFAYRTSQFGQGTGPIWLDNIHCTGTEARLDQCPHNGIGVHNCIHFEDAGVQCTSKNYVRLELVRIHTYICTFLCLAVLYHYKFCHNS